MDALPVVVAFDGGEQVAVPCPRLPTAVDGRVPPSGYGRNSPWIGRSRSTRFSKRPVQEDREGPCWTRRPRTPASAGSGRSAGHDGCRSYMAEIAGPREPGSRSGASDALHARGWPIGPLPEEPHAGEVIYSGHDGRHGSGEHLPQADNWQPIGHSRDATVIHSSRSSKP